MFAQQFVVVDKTKHDLKSFDCGKPKMNEFLARFAVKHMEVGISRTWVLTLAEPLEKQEKFTIAAYYTLAIETVKRHEIPFPNSLPTYPLPVVLLARLAVNKIYQNQRVGEKSLIAAFRKAVELTEVGLPAIGVVLDVLDDCALKFYQQFEVFESFTNDPMRLFLPMNVAKQI
jgi:hypothetical protein